MPRAGGSAAGHGSDAVGGRDAASVGPAASGGQTSLVAAQPQAGPPPAADMVSTTHPHPGRPGSAGSRFALRNWRVRWRLAALIAVPLVTAVVLGALTIHGDVTNWQATGRVQHLAQLNSAVVKYIQALEDERDYTVASTANTAGFAARLRTARRVTDGAAAQVAALADGITAGGGYQVAAVQAAYAVKVGVDTLPLVRKAVADPGFPSSAIMQVYTVNIIQPAQTFASVVGNEASNTDLRHDVIALGALLQVQDSKSVQRALMLRAVSFPQPSLSSDDDASLQQAHQQEVADLANFNGSVDLAEQQYYGNTVTGAPVDVVGQQEQLAEALLTGPGPHRLTQEQGRLLAAANVNDDMSFTIGKVRQVADELTGTISTLANTSRTNSSTALLVTSLVTLLLLFLVLLISSLVARSLTRPLRKLRADALDVAGHRLPEMVLRLSQSEGTDESVDIEPIGVTSTDEIGEVARAFDQVHREAVRLAADEAMLRGNLNAMFINLSRRSQSLIERQLSLIDSLEQSEQDSGRLSSLFRLDHLATRMRRNSENLLVLAGHEVTRRWSQPVPLVDVLRAAISEIEQYERVVLNVQPGIVVVGQAVNDVVHLVAEIVENATTFSPEDTQVYVSGQPLSSGGVLLDITDNGVGISDQEMSHANWRLDNPPVVDVAVSRRMGLFVVGRLAARHGVRARLRHAQAGGLTALIWLPDTVAAPEVAPPLGRLRRFEADDYGPAASLSAPPQASDTTAARIPRFSSMSPPASPSFTPAADAGPGARPGAGSGGTGPSPVAGNGWDADPAQTLPVRGKSNGITAPANGATDADEIAPRNPAAPAGPGVPGGQGSSGPGPSRLPAFGGQVPPHAPRVPSIGSQDVRGGDGPSAGDPGANGGQATDGAPDPGTVTVPPPASQDQRLPIYDSLESDWFRRSGKSLSTARPAAGAPAAAAAGQSWTSPADEGWRAAQALAVPSAGDTTQAGLPRRVPRANLVPGSVGGGGGDAEADAPTRSPDVVRTRMASFQRGVREGRAAAPQTEEP
ncbi:MAG TPA: nitrate- and nitrite sensing domain-containing protein [Streptosporangiaceae bacterium]|nr:nitrate- and nitrite sensing domain-containing protein [Streptosporangiaceae bacterium]